MHELVYLKELLIILGFAVIVVVVFHRLKLPSIAGFILSGILVGPRGLGLISDIQQVGLTTSATFAPYNVDYDYSLGVVSHD